MNSFSIFILTLGFTVQLIMANPVTSFFGGVNVETPPFTIVSKGDNYEVRRYEPQLWAQVEYTVDPSTDFGDGSYVGFRPLFEYITGKNARKQKIPMTAPVVMQRLSMTTGKRRMAFIMPASLFKQLDQLPEPTNNNVQLVEVNQPLVLACKTFNMGINNKRLAEKEAELREKTATDLINLVTDVESIRVGGYNPPWTLPWFRTNELCIPLENQA